MDDHASTIHLNSDVYIYILHVWCVYIYRMYICHLCMAHVGVYIYIYIVSAY